MQLRKAILTLPVRKGAVNEARPGSYVMIVKHGFDIYERAQPDFSKRGGIHSTLYFRRARAKQSGIFPHKQNRLVAYHE